MSGFHPGPKLPDFQKLKIAFVGARDQIKNYLLFQTIIQLLDATQKMRDIFKGDIDDTTGTLENATFLTEASEIATLPQSRQVLAGDGIVFDDSVANERTVSAGAIGYDSPLVLSLNPGDSELVLGDNGAPIIVFFPTA